MAKEILYIDGVTGLGEHEGDAWPYAQRFQVPMGDGDGIRNHIFKNEGRFFSDALGGDYNVYYGEESYIYPKNKSTGFYPWIQFGCWMQWGTKPNYDVFPFYGYRNTTALWYAYTGIFRKGKPYLPEYNNVYFKTSWIYPPDTDVDMGVTFGPIVPKQWFWHEARIYCHTSSGIAEFRLNGTGIGRITGVKTVNTAGTSPPTGEIKMNGANFFYPDWYSNTYNVKYDDMYVMFADTEGELDWVGKGVCEPLYVNGDGAEIMATPIGPTSHASVEFPVNDILYVTATAGERDCYSFSNLESDRTRTVHGVKVTARARRGYPGTATIRCYCRVSGSNYYGDTHYLSPEWREYIHIWAQNPDTSTAWTREDLDAAQFGFERVA